LLNHLRVEWLKIWRRSFERNLALVFLALGIVLPPALVSFSRLPGSGDISACLIFPDNLSCATDVLGRLAPLLGAVLGASIVGSEYSLGTMGFSIALSGDRTRLFGAKVLILCGYCFVTLCVGLATWVGFASLSSVWLANAPRPTASLVDGVATTFALSLSVAFNGVLGIVGATLARSEYGGVLVGAAMLMIGRVPPGRAVGAWLPQNHIANVGCRLGGMPGVPCPGSCSAPASFLLLAVYAGVILAVGCAALNRQELE